MTQAPIWSIPLPGDTIGPSVSSAHSIWHLPPEKYQPIWDTIDASKIKIAILDTGGVLHPDLPEPVHAVSMVPGESWRDGNGHGTHCAGSALGLNGIGFCPGAQLIVIKVLSNRGSGSSAWIAKGIEKAIDLGADVISLSLGGSQPYGPTQEAGRRAQEAGVICVAASGNAGDPGYNTIGYPAKFPEFASIAAYRVDRKIATFTSAGNEVDVAMPGQDIISASNRGGRVSMSGTSMATPCAAGLAGLMQAYRLSRGYARLDGTKGFLEAVTANVEDIHTPGKDRRSGHGIPRDDDIIKELMPKGVEWI